MRAGTRETSGRRAPPSRVHVLLPVWKPRYIAQFLDVSLPTLLASDNVPSLARTLPCKFTVLTRQQDAPLLHAHPRWHALAGTCEVETLLIDDLIRDDNHAMTLTLAYSQALRAAGEAMLDTCFMLLVSDYIVANGSLPHALSQVQSGASGILSGSIQVVAEDAIPWIRELMHPSSTSVALTPRQLMHWSRDHLHATSLASIVNRPLTHNAYANRLFWRVDGHTLLGRFYLMHPIALHPEVSDFQTLSSCDYSFIPELCPSGNVVAVTDSDDLLIVEAQPRDHEFRQLRPGPITPRKLARSLSEWTTAQHRINVAFTLVFHGKGLPDCLAASIAEANDYLACVERNMVRNPQSHRHHPYWIGAKILSGAAPAWPDAGASPRIWFETLLWRLSDALLGRPPQVSVWHARWPDFHLLHRHVQRRSADQSTIVIARSAARFGAWLGAAGASVQALELEQLFAAAPREVARCIGAFDTCVMVVSEIDIGQASQLISRWACAAKPGGRMLLLLTNDANDRVAALSSQIPHLVGQFAPRIAQVRCVRRGARQTLDSIFADLMRGTRRRRILHLPLALAGAGLCAMAIAACNLWTLLLVDRPPSAFTRCSSLLLILQATPCQARGNGVGNADLDGVPGTHAGGARSSTRMEGRETQ